MNATLWVGLGIIVASLGWYARVWWEEFHPRYIVIPDLSEDRDNTGPIHIEGDSARKS